MRITFHCDNGANIHSERKEEFDTEADFGLTAAEWKDLSDETKNEYLEDWAMSNFDYWLEEGEDD
jgi:hypothetical protein